MLMRASGVLALTQLILYLTHNLTAILILRLIQGGFAGFTASAQAWLIYSTSDQRHGHLIGKVQAFMAMGTIFGPVIGGIIAHYSSYAGIFLVSGTICVLITFLISLFLKEKK